MRKTAASSRVSVPTRSASGRGKEGRPRRTCASSAGRSLQAQPDPWLISVRRGRRGGTVGGLEVLGGAAPAAMVTRQAVDFDRIVGVAVDGDADGERDVGGSQQVA